MNNSYVTVRTTSGMGWTDFYVNVVGYDGTMETQGQHSYAHKRSARRAAIALAKKRELSYRQDLEYSDKPFIFIPVTA